MAIIQVQNLTFEYPQLTALDDVSFDIAPQTVTAIVGPNGAGKTTLMNCLAALTRPQAGCIHIDGLSVLDAPRQSHEILGYLPDNYGLYDDLTVAQCLRYMAMAQQVARSEFEQAIERAVERLQCQDLLTQRAGQLSRGQRQRLAIAQAVIHQPKVLLLDEPAGGLDPEARHHLSSIIVDMAREGMTVLVSSHILSELEDYCTHVLMVRKGKIISHTDVQTMQTSDANQRQLVLTLAQPVPDLAQALARVSGISAIEINAGGDGAVFMLTGENSAQQACLKQLIDNGVPVTALTPKTVSLQDTYLKRMSER